MLIQRIGRHNGNNWHIHKNNIRKWHSRFLDYSTLINAITMYVILYYQTNQSQFPLLTSPHQKTFRRNPAQKASRADFYQFLRIRKKHWDGSNKTLRWLEQKITMVQTNHRNLLFAIRILFRAILVCVIFIIHHIRRTFYRITPLIKRRAQSRQLHTHEIRYFGKNH